MGRYGGGLSYTIYIFKQYLLLSDSIVIAAMIIGLCATAAGIVMIYRRPAKKYVDILFFVSLVPFCLGIIGSFTTTRDAWDAIRIEKNENLQSSANKYYDYQYLFSKYMLYSFPGLVGFASTFPPLVISMRLKRRKA
jgi:vacuolar-type H+-ATPase subunit I/STV1